jgi:hypothetical protein
MKRLSTGLALILLRPESSREARERFPIAPLARTKIEPA